MCPTVLAIQDITEISVILDAMHFILCLTQQRNVPRSPGATEVSHSDELAQQDIKEPVFVGDQMAVALNAVVYCNSLGCLQNTDAWVLVPGILISLIWSKVQALGILKISQVILLHRLN